MKTKDIEFNADDLVGSVEAFAHHLTGKQNLTLRTATMPLPPRIKSLTASQVRSNRKQLNVSQPIFAAIRVRSFRPDGRAAARLPAEEQRVPRPPQDRPTEEPTR